MPDPEFPPTPPTPYRRGVDAALPQGSWVTGRNGAGLWGLPDHRGHVIVLCGGVAEVDEKHSNAGYRQAARCLDCSSQFSIRLDGEFLQERCSDEYLHADLDRLDTLIVKAKKARKRIVKELTS